MMRIRRGFDVSVWAVVSFRLWSVQMLDGCGGVARSSVVSVGFNA